jgi:hypothetical protein
MEACEPAGYALLGLMIFMTAALAILMRMVYRDARKAREKIDEYERMVTIEGEILKGIFAHAGAMGLEGVLTSVGYQYCEDDSEPGTVVFIDPNGMRVVLKGLPKVNNL